MSKDKTQPEQLETPVSHNGKNHKRLVESVRDAKPDSGAQSRAAKARKTATGQSK